MLQLTLGASYISACCSSLMQYVVHSMVVNGHRFVQHVGPAETLYLQLNPCGNITDTTDTPFVTSD